MESAMPTFRQLEYLVALQETRHFRRAAEKVHASQSTLSLQLKALEARLGVQLVERTHTQVVMTTIGSEMAAMARRALREVRDIRDLAAAQREEFSGVVRLGLPPTKAPYFLPRVVPHLQKAHPDLKLYVREDLPRSLATTLQEGGYDIIILPLPVSAPELQCLPLYREPLYVACAASHPLAREARVHRASLKGLSVLVLSPGHQLHDVVMTLCEEMGAKPLLDYEGTSLDTLCEMVAMGMGITFLPGLFVRTMLANHKNIKALELHGRPVHRTIGMVWRRASARHVHYERLARLFSEVIQREHRDFAPK
ncbi:MAG: LysR substrate-binding domain-containing protein [Hyphomicrobiaceae bacterium]